MLIERTFGSWGALICLYDSSKTKIMYNPTRNSRDDTDMDNSLTWDPVRYFIITGTLFANINKTEGNPKINICLITFALEELAKTWVW